MPDPETPEPTDPVENGGDPTTEPDAGGESGETETPAEGGIEVTDKRLNSFYQSAAAEVAAKMVAEESYLSALISRNAEKDLLGGGGKGRSVNVKIPAALVARRRDIDETQAAIVLDSLHETYETIQLGDHIYSAVGLGEGELNLDLRDFSAQVLAPQVDAVVDQIEDDVARALNAVPVDCATTAGSANTYDSLSTLASAQNADLLKIFTALRKQLREAGIPQSGLQVVVGTEVYAKLLDMQVLIDASASGSTQALRDGNVGKLRGFTLVESTRVNEHDIIAFHKDAFTLAVRAPMVPAGISGSISSHGGFQLRAMRDYDTMHTLHRSVVGTFAGVAAMPLYKVVRDRTNGTAAIERVENGGVVHITTDATRLATIKSSGTVVKDASGNNTTSFVAPVDPAEVARDTVAAEDDD